MSKFHQVHTRRVAVILISLVTSQGALAWEPGTGDPTAADGFSVDTSNRRDALAFYQCAYQASEDYATNMGWTGSVAGGVPGTTTAVFKEDVRRRINYFRAMAGQPGDVTFNTTKSDKCQKAALMMSANNALSHNPPSNWTWYTADGAEAAGASNLALGFYGPDAINGYMRDDGTGNEPVGHRRWLLYPRAQEMGTGDIPPSGSYSAANALWVIGNFKSAPSPTFVAWPNEGFVPDSLVPARWSLSYAGANFGSATVTMTQNGSNVPLTVVSRTQTGIGDNTIVWQPSGVPSSVTNDLPYVVTISGIGGSGVPTSETYTVTLFNPDILGDSVTLTGSDTTPPSGAQYSFNSIEQADSYEFEVSSLSGAAWTEGAEDSPTPQISEAISPGYSLRQTSLKRTGAKAFHLATPSGIFTDQAFTITRNIVPSTNSQLQYYDRARWTVNTTTLEAQVSADNGNTWTTVVSRNGVSVSGSSNEWDSNWKARSASLAAYAGQPVILRFIMKLNGGATYPGTDSNYGFFIDDITVTQATQLVAPTITTLSGDATSFTLNSTSAGSSLISGTSYIIRVRPYVGCHWFGFGPTKSVTVIDPPPSPTFDTWASDFETANSLPPGSLADPLGDFDHDGRANLIEYAFGTSPVASNDPASALPSAQTTETHFVLQYQIDTSLADVTITPQAGSTLNDWKAPGEAGAPAGFTDELISTDGSIETREASVPRSAGANFLRVSVSRQ